MEKHLDKMFWKEKAEKEETETCVCFFVNVGTPKESIFFDQRLWSIFRSSLHIRLTDCISSCSNEAFAIIIVNP